MAAAAVIRGISHCSHRSSAGWFRKVHSEQAHCGPSRPAAAAAVDGGGGGAGRAGRGGRGEEEVVRAGTGGGAPGDDSTLRAKYFFIYNILVFLSIKQLPSLPIKQLRHKVA